MTEIGLKSLGCSPLGNEDRAQDGKVDGQLATPEDDVDDPC